MGSLVQRVLSPILSRLGSRTILSIGGTLFLLNMLIPDPIPLVDEFLILAATILLSRWADPGASSATGSPATTGAPGATDADRATGARGASGPTGAHGAPKHVGRGSTTR
jgi:hypothetical protein